MQARIFELEAELQRLQRTIEVGAPSSQIATVGWVGTGSANNIAPAPAPRVLWLQQRFPAALDDDSHNTDWWDRGGQAVLGLFQSAELASQLVE